MPRKNSVSKKRKAAKMQESSQDLTSALAVQPQETSARPGTMTEWTFRKLISATKSVIALKDPTTKRRFSEIFLEKPCAQTYPDYSIKSSKGLLLSMTFFANVADNYMLTCKSSATTGSSYYFRMQENSTERNPGSLWMLAPRKKSWNE